LKLWNLDFWKPPFKPRISETSNSILLKTLLPQNLEIWKRFWITLPKNYFTENFRPKHHLTECHLTESTFVRIAVNFTENLTWKTSQMTEMRNDRKFIWPKAFFEKWSFGRKVIWPKSHLTEKSFDRMLLFEKINIEKWKRMLTPRIFRKKLSVKWSFSEKAFGQMNFRSNDICTHFIFGQMTFFVESRKFGQMTIFWKKIWCASKARVNLPDICIGNALNLF
jgi:hypothetical protein